MVIAFAGYRFCYPSIWYDRKKSGLSLSHVMDILNRSMYEFSGLAVISSNKAKSKAGAGDLP